MFNKIVKIVVDTVVAILVRHQDHKKGYEYTFSLIGGLKLLIL